MFQTNGPWYAVETGRRDGRVSSDFDANNDLPGPNTTIVDLKIYFSFKGMGWKDIVVLSGAYVIPFTVNKPHIYICLLKCKQSYCPPMANSLIRDWNR